MHPAMTVGLQMYHNLSTRVLDGCDGLDLGQS